MPTKGEKLLKGYDYVFFMSVVPRLSLRCSTLLLSCLATLGLLITLRCALSLTCLRTSAHPISLFLSRLLSAASALPRTSLLLFLPSMCGRVVRTFLDHFACLCRDMFPRSACARLCVSRTGPRETAEGRVALVLSLAQGKRRRFCDGDAPL